MPIDKAEQQLALSPVDDDGFSRPRPGVALCLSGGGYRAMVFHLGVLWRLNELGYLARLDRISSVSGGSITAGLLGLRWGRLDFAGGSILVARRPEAIGHRLRCRIHARDVSLALDKPQASSILNVFRGTVSAIVATDTPGHVLVQLQVAATAMPWCLNISCARCSAFFRRRPCRLAYTP